MNQSMNGAPSGILLQDEKLARTRYGCSARLEGNVELSVCQEEVVVWSLFAVAVRFFVSDTKFVCPPGCKCNIGRLYWELERFRLRDNDFVVAPKAVPWSF